MVKNATLAVGDKPTLFSNPASVVAGAELLAVFTLDHKESLPDVNKAIRRSIVMLFLVSSLRKSTAEGPKRFLVHPEGQIKA